MQYKIWGRKSVTWRMCWVAISLLLVIHFSPVLITVAQASQQTPMPTITPTPTQAPTLNFGNYFKANVLSLAALLGAMVAIFGVIGKVFKPVREWFVKWIRKSLQIVDINKAMDDRIAAIEKRVALDAEDRKKEYAVMTGQNASIEGGLSALIESVGEINRKLGLSEESNRSLVRDAITKIFYKYCKRQAIPIHEKENMARLYDVYRRYSGNSYVCDLMEVANNWEVLSGDDAPSCHTK